MMRKQYAAAEKLDLVLVSFDGDFDPPGGHPQTPDRTDRGRKTPAELH